MGGMTITDVVASLVANTQAALNRAEAELEPLHGAQIRRMMADLARNPSAKHCLAILGAVKEMYEGTYEEAA